MPMRWLIRTLGGAVIGGLGWKLGADAYDYVKRRLNGDDKDKDKAAKKGEEAQAGAEQNDADADAPPIAPLPPVGTPKAQPVDAPPTKGEPR